MAKSLIKIKARLLRKQGMSIKDIAKKLQISSSSASIWCRDINLSQKQINKLLLSKEKNITKGRLKGAFIQKMKKVKALQLAKKEALKLRSLTKDLFFVAGLALYLAEGSKKMDRVQFTNSNPKIIHFMLKWFKKFYGINSGDIKCTILINNIHRNRDSELKRFWQKFLKINPNQFTDIRYIQTSQKKIYDNSRNYFGTFSFRVNKSTHLLYKLNALTDRLISLI